MKRSSPIVLLLMMVLATACQNAAPVRTVQTPTEAPPEIITIDLGYYPRDTNAPVIDQLVTAFEKRYPEYRVRKVEVPPLGPDYLTVLEQRLKAGEYDLFPIISDDGALWQSLDPYLNRSLPEMQKVADAAKSLRVAGFLYQIPILLVPECFQVNRDIWEAAGLPLPEPGWSWDEFRAAAARLSHGEGADRVWGFATGWHELLLSAWLMQTAGQSFWLAKEADLREGLRFFTGLVQTDKSLPVPQPRDWGNGEVRMSNSDLFPGKQAAIGYGSVLLLPFMNRWLTFRWDILPMPTRGGGIPVLRVRPFVYSMAASSTEKDAAWEFLRFAAGPEGAAVVAAAGAIPTDGSSVMEGAWAVMQPAPPPGTAHVLNTPWVTDGMDYGRPGETLVIELYRLTNLALRGELDPDTAVTQYLQFRKRYVAD